MVFLGGCNLRCPYCQNRSLAEGPWERIPLDDLWAALDGRDLLDGVAVSGGEPLLSPALRPILEGARSRGLETKLDTNGTLPDRLKPLLDASLIDYIAMDLKVPPEAYGRVGGEGLGGSVLATLDLLRDRGTAFELRTTVPPSWLSLADAAAMAAAALAGGPVRLWALQPFRPDGCLDPAMRSLPRASREELEPYAEVLRAAGVSRVVVRA